MTLSDTLDKLFSKLDVHFEKLQDIEDRIIKLEDKLTPEVESRRIGL